jgi:hypothetical protein
MEAILLPITPAEFISLPMQLLMDYGFMDLFDDVSQLN